MTEEQIKQKTKEKLSQARIDYCHSFISPCEPDEVNLNEMVRFNSVYELGFIDGYHEYQKEHEWHYCKEELPDYNGQFYVALKGHTETFILNYDYDEYDESKMVWLDDDGTNFDAEVYAWQEKLKAPKEIEK